MPQAQPIPLKIAPGFYSETGDRDAVGRWKTGDRVRFKNNLPEKLGGWEEIDLTGATMYGIDRREHEWASLDGQPWLAIGTSRKLYVINRGIRYDITPIRRTVTVDDPFTTDGTTTVVVMDLLHGAETGDFVRFSGATPVGGQTIDGEYAVTVLNGNQYTITIPVAATPATGGGAVAIEYDINVGNDSAEQAHGWGTCTYNTGTYGTRRGDCSAIIIGPRIWSLDNFGEDLMASPRGGALYWWDRSTGPGSRAVLVETAPPTIERMLVSPSGDQVIALGAFDSVSGSPDKMLIRASAIGTFADWEIPIDPEEDTTVFDYRLSAGSRIITGFKTRGGVVVQTDKATYLMRADPTEIYSIGDPIATGNPPVGPNASIDIDGTGFWFSADKIMVFDGVQAELPCDVWGFVFDNVAAGDGKSPGFNSAQSDKVYAYYNPKGDEVTFLYPSLDSDENNRYVCFNKTLRVWYYGSIARTAMSTGGIAFTLPYGSGPDGELFLHEGVPDADGELMGDFVESWDLQLSEGAESMHVSMYIPDPKRWVGDLRLQLKVKDRPNQVSYVTSTYDMEDDTIEQGVHVCGRQVAIRFGSIELGSSWRFAPGTLLGQPDGSR